MKSISLDVMHAAQLFETSSNISLRKPTYETLKRLRDKNPSNVIIAFLNINSIHYKFEDLKFFCTNNVDILLIGETRLDSSFPDTQFLIEGCNKPLRLDAPGRSRGLLDFTKSHLPTRQLTKRKIPMDIQILIFELNLRKEKWLVVSACKPPIQYATYFLKWLSEIIDFHSIMY